MIGRTFRIEPDDTTTLALAAEALRAWEPLWDLYRPPRHARLYDADGTLYGFCLQQPMTVDYNRREQVLNPGDLIVVPRELALDIEPSVDLLALRFEGQPPDHFRERFIQVWGFDRLSAPADTLASNESTAVVPESDPRFPLTYALERLSESEPTVRETGLETTLVIALDGQAQVTVDGARDRETLTIVRGGAVLIGPGLRYSTVGNGLVGRAVLFTDLEHQARQARASAAGRVSSPEYDSHSRGLG